ncbi:MAG TPA: tetratricopeptide repeat protein [Chitinophagaceae bacterium]|jgi:tetratricopeptide (TPR) repeat protein|nr:tetratricopeptide repeat protein [Chitinophagaceae bacterium]
MKKNILILTLVISVAAHAQTDKATATRMLRDAIRAMDGGDPDRAMLILDSAKKLDPTDYVYDYEKGYAAYLKKDYKQSVKFFETALAFPGANDQCYQMLGNALDSDGKPEKAMKAYEDGIKRFPTSGGLHVELGVMALANKKYDEAVGWWEKGIAANPTYPGNYYRLTKLFAFTKDPIWAFFYGEIFLNLEPTTQRSEDISKTIFDAYKRNITVPSDTSLRVDFTNSNLFIDKSTDMKNFKMPFRLIYVGDFIVGISMNFITDKQISLASLVSARTSFIDRWYKAKRDKDYPNIVIEHQKRIADAGHSEAYHYWVLSSGDEKAFTEWYKNNEEKFKAFAKWIPDNMLVIDKDHLFIRPKD